MKKYNNLRIAIVYYFVHFILEVTCFYIITSYTKNPLFWTISLFYDFFAFVPQSFYGAIYDKYTLHYFEISGIVFVIIALFLFYLKLPFLIVFSLLTIGNCIVHVSGAEMTLRTAEGNMFPSSLFVSGGALGIFFGRFFYTSNISLLIILLLDIIAFILILYANQFKDKKRGILNKYQYSNTKVPSHIIIIIAIIVVSIRSFMSYGIPLSWNHTILDGFFLYFFMMLGKALGGFLIDTIGIRITTYISTIFSLPFILFGNSIMYLSLIGIVFFSMTMAITLAIIISECKDRPGVGFGYTTIGLFIGTLPMFFFTFDTTSINKILFTSLTFLCTIVLEIIIKEEV